MTFPQTTYSETDFFTYLCDQCSTPFCERVHILNLVLSYVDDEYCLNCLVNLQSINTEESENTVVTEAWMSQMLTYVMARDCFKMPWESFQTGACPRKTNNQCFCG